MKQTTAETQAHQEFEAAREAVLEAYANFLEARRHLKKAAKAAGVEFRETASEQLDEALARMRDRKQEVQDSASEYVRANPLTSTDLAFLGGVILSRLLGK